MQKFCLTLSCFLFIILHCTAQDFVQQREGKFFLKDQEYKFIGTNYWYGIYLPLMADSTRGIIRLRKELDFLKSKGVTNLRVLAGAEGSGKILGNERVGPPLQTGKGVFDTSVLYGLDVLLDEMRKRDMKAVIFFSNNWEWSGGFLQYLNWNGLLSDSALRHPMQWEDMQTNISRFYSCQGCKSDYLRQVKLILARKNARNGLRYVDDPTIMTWEIANEPRPMKPEAVPSYTKWIRDVAAFIKSVDSNHLVCTGHEGVIAATSETYDAIHADKNIDYLTIHIWPKNWGWIKTMQDTMLNMRIKTRRYVGVHQVLQVAVKKPLVIEEFGLPRDDERYAANTPVSNRDAYYDFIFSMLTSRLNSDISGINFWAFNGMARPKTDQLFWKKGDDYMGDPPMEQQSLYGVFDSDTSTWKVVKKHALLLQQQLTNHR